MMPSANATTILLIDDSPEDRHTYKSYLTTHGDRLYTFLEADNAEDGLEICRQTHLDCIILDFELPDMTGLQFLGRLAGECTDGLPPVVMVTGRGSETVAVAALKAGASDYLVKSDVSIQSVFRATNNALEISQLNRSLAQETHDRQGAESELRESESRYRLLVESVQDYAIMMLDLNGKITSWNAGARKMFGFHNDEIIAQHIRQLYPPVSGCERVVDGELEKAAKYGPQTVDGYLMRKDGSRFWSTGSISAVQDRWGQTLGFSKVVRQSHAVDATSAPDDVDIGARIARLQQEAIEPLLQVKQELAVADEMASDPSLGMIAKLERIIGQLQKIAH